MATRVQDLDDQQLLDTYNSWFNANTGNWTLGVALLPEISRRFGARIDREKYLSGLRRIISIKPSLKGREEHFFPADFIIPIDEIRRLVEEMTRDVCLAAIENINIAPLGTTLRYELPLIKDLAQFSEQADSLLGDRKAIFSDMTSRRLLTFGSCFAVNIGRVLREKGCSVYTLVIAEDVNSPFNNLQLLKRIFKGENTTIADELKTISGLDYEVIRSEFLKATDIIFTLGNIYHLEADGEPTLFARNGAEIVEETVEETVRCISEIFEILSAHTNAKILASVSPIPISGYRGHTFHSAIEADCVSKSQLRAALHASLKSHPEVMYMPTFEVFRWLPAHQAFPTFGVDDGNARHIAQVLLNKVLDSIVGQ